MKRQLAVTQYSRVTEDVVVFEKAASQSKILMNLQDTNLAPTFLGIMQDHPDGTNSTCLVQKVETDMSTLKRFLVDEDILDDTWLDITLSIAKAVEI